ncbi:UNVERIFIED_CONTAM: G-box binding factor [Gekko kuhli]
MRAGGMSDSSKWKKQKRSPRASCHVSKTSSGSEQPASSGTGISSNMTGSSENTSSAVSPSTDSGLETSSQMSSKEDLTDFQSVSPLGICAAVPLSEPRCRDQPEPQNDYHPEEKTPSASVESIPEVLEECTSAAEHSDSTSVHDMDYVNPRGVRFTQCSQKEGTALVPYGLPCIRELLRFLISLTNPHDRHHSDVMIHMGLQLLTVALELASVAKCPSLLGLVKEELCRYLFQVSLDGAGTCRVIKCKAPAFP